MSRAAQLDCQHLHSCALVLTLFLFQKGQGFFPPLPIAALLRRSWLWAYAPLAGWDVSMWLVYFCNTKGQRDFKSTLAFAISTGREPHQTGEPRGLLPSGGSFAAKPHVSRAVPRPMGAVRGQGVLPLARAMRPVAEWRSI